MRGHSFPLEGRPFISGGKHVLSNGTNGIVFGISPEAEALHRWRKEEFEEVERRFARGWRALLAAPGKRPGEDYLRWHRQGLNECNSLLEIRKLSQTVIASRSSSPHERMKFVFDVLGLTRDLAFLSFRYQKQGAPALPDYAPYTSHFLEVGVFFRFAMDRGLISPERSSNRSDIAYLKYLLAKINERNQAFPPEVRERGIMSFAPKPPTEGDFLTARLWDKSIDKTWRDGEKLVLEPNIEKELMENLLALKKAPAASTSASRLRPTKPMPSAWTAVFVAKKTTGIRCQRT